MNLRSRVKYGLVATAFLALGSYLAPDWTYIVVLALGYCGFFYYLERSNT